MVLFAEHHLTTLFFIIRHLLIIISLYTTYWFIAYNIINVATIDIIILIVIGAGAIVGFVKGFIRQLASILGLIVGLLAAKALYASLAEKLCPTVTDSMTVAQVLAFIMIWIAVPLIFVLIASLLTTRRSSDLIEFVDSDNKLISATKKEESLLYYPMETFAGIFFPAAKNMTQQYILENKDKDATRTQ